MLDYYYKERRTLVDFRRGPLGPFFDGFAASLKDKGYSSAAATMILSRCCPFNHFLTERGITHARSISPAQVEPFLKGYLGSFRTSSNSYSAPGQTRCALRHLFGYLVARGVIKHAEQRPPRTSYSWILESYIRHLRKEREIGEKSVTQNAKIISAFLKGLGKRAGRQSLKRLSPESVEDYIQAHVEASPENRIRLGSTLRGFLRFCSIKRYITQDLSGLVPSTPRYRLASLPRGIEDKAVERLLTSIPRDSMPGCRDYAIVLLMAVYSLRAVQVVKLRLEDIHWSRSTIRIGAAKSGKEVLLPLLGPVGEALLSYLRHRPENSPFREVFLAVHAPLAPLSGMAVSRVARDRMTKAGIKVPRTGSGTLRHSWAIRALAHDTPIKAIADVMGHRWLNTTFVYAKADLKMLRQAAGAWPEATR